MIYTPLEQFSIVSILPIRIGNLFLSFTNSSLYMLLATGLVSLPVLSSDQRRRVLGSFTLAICSGNDLSIRGKLSRRANRGTREKIFPTYLDNIPVSLKQHLVGMIPYSFTATSHLVVTFGLSYSLFIGITAVGFHKHGIHFFSFLLPKGAPLALAPLLVVLELVSYCFRAVSLGVRLFANMMAGHTLVKNN